WRGVEYSPGGRGVSRSEHRLVGAAALAVALRGLLRRDGGVIRVERHELVDLVAHLARAAAALDGALEDERLDLLADQVLGVGVGRDAERGERLLQLEE